MRMDMARVGVQKYEYKSIAIIHSEEKREKKIVKISSASINNKNVTGVLVGEGKVISAEKFEEI
jgi:hypothetical protein